MADDAFDCPLVSESKAAKLAAASGMAAENAAPWRSSLESLDAFSIFGGSNFGELRQQQETSSAHPQ
jgi:hypothetical protein